ncbi:MAG: hypothetical protein ACO1NW_09490 [Chitinophagaceae bacterium]
MRDFSDSIVIADVLITNISLKTKTLSNGSGSFSIKANAFDTLIFSIAGYAQDTLLVDDDFFRTEIDIFIRRKATELKTVVVQADRYRRDSIEARERYNLIAADKEKVLMRNHGNGFGITLSPFSYLSKKEKDRRQLLKREKREEEAAYVDYRFARSKVMQLTGLRGDSLQTFMLRYRPSYAFCKKASEEDITLHINASLKAFLRREDQEK